MRILMVQTYHFYRGGDSTYMFNLSRLLEAHGHEVIPFAMEHPRNLDSPYSAYFAEEIDFPALLQNFSVSAAVKVLSRSIYNRQARKQIQRLIADTKPDIAHFHNIHGHLSSSIIGPLEAAGIPILWTLHDYRMVCPNTSFLRDDRVCEDCLPHRYYNVVVNRCKKGSLPASVVALATTAFDLLTRVPKRVDRFLTPSAFLRSKMIQGGMEPSRLKVLPNFVEVDDFQSGPEEDYSLFFGRLSHEKGVDLLIRAAAELGSGKLRIVGDGPAADELKRLATELGAPVEFAGFMSGEDLHRQLAGARFVVVPSRCYENLPFSVMEALACGKPVLAAAIGGIPEMVEHDVNGLLFPAGDIAALKQALSRLEKDADLRRRMGVAGREKAEALYNPQEHYQQISRHYEEVLKNRD